MSDVSEVVTSAEMLAAYPLDTIVAEYRKDGLVMSVMYKTEHFNRGEVWVVTGLPSPISSEDAWGEGEIGDPDTELRVLSLGPAA